MSLKSFFARLTGRSESTSGSGSSDSVFLKTIAADTKVEIAKARIKAVDTLNAMKHEVAAELEKEAERVHTEADKVKSRLDGVLDKL